MEMKHSFNKEERLKSKKVIDSLFQKGQSFGQYPLRVVWVEMEERFSEFPAQFAMSVPKKKFAKAVSRNKIRRKVREAYRTNKWKFYKKLEGREKQLGLMILYVAKVELGYTEIEKAMKSIFHRLSKKIQPRKPKPPTNPKSSSEV